MKSLIKIFSIFLLWLMAGFSAFSQGTMLWEKQVPIPISQYLNKSVQSHSKKFWVGVGETSTYQSTGVCCGPIATTIVAYKDSTGDTLWTRTATDLYPNIASRAGSVVRAPNNNFWVILTFDWAFIAGQGTATGVCVIEMDSIGQVLTTREFLRDCNYIAMGNVSSLPDGGFIMAGTLTRYTGCQSNSEMFAIRLNGDGETAWQNIYAMAGNQSIWAAMLFPNNSLNIVYTESGSNNARCAWIDLNSGIIVKTTNAPAATITGGSVNFSYPLSDGGYLICYSRSITGFPTNISYGNIAYTDAHFNTIWHREDNTVTGFGNPMETTDGSIVLKSRSNINPKPPIILKLKKATGIEEWRRVWPSTSNHEINGIDLASNGDVMVSGTDDYMSYYMAKLTGVADFLQPSDYCTDSVRANFTGTWQQDTLRLRSTSNSGMAYQDSLNYQWLIEGSTVSIDSAVQQVKDAALYPNGLPVTLVITNFWGCKDTLTAKVMPDGTVVGNRPVETGHALSLRNAYPNPSTQNVAIGYTLPTKTENAVLRVYELGTGRTVAERNLSALDSEVKFNVSGWATGVYAYQLYVNGAPVAVKKLTVSK